MNTRLFTTLLAFAATATGLQAADEEPAPRTNMKEVLRARIAEDAKKNVPASTPAPTPSKTEKTEATTAGPDAASPPTAEAPKDPAAKSSPAKQPATILPKVEVRKSRITVLDQQLAKQDEDIAREKKNLKSSEADIALNDAKIAKPLAIFGGDSTQFRKRVASERVALMEAEKDVMVAIAQAKTKKEKEELQKQLDELKAMRRELDKTLR